jgi:hypothetical protein
MGKYQRTKSTEDFFQKKTFHETGGYGSNDLLKSSQFGDEIYIMLSLNYCWFYRKKYPFFGWRYFQRFQRLPVVGKKNPLMDC